MKSLKQTEEFKNYTKARDEYKELIKVQGIKLIKQELDSTREIVPELVRIVWEQYTPYFNDGETCTFRVYDFCFLLNKDDLNENEEATSSWDLHHEKRITENQRILLDALRKELDDELFLETFGDHVQVSYDFKTFTISEYEHE